MAQKKHIYPLLSLVIGLAMISGCLSTANTGDSNSDMNHIIKHGSIWLNYNSGCEGQGFGIKDNVSVIGGDKGFKFKHILSYLCCANISLDFNITNRSINIIEKNVGGICKCMCKYEIDGKIHGLAPGQYTVSIWGIAYDKDDIHQNPKLLANKTISITS